MFPRAGMFPIQLVLMKPVLSGYWSRKNRHKCLMVIEDILRRKGSDTQCVFLSGEKCLYQAGRSQWLGKQWIVWASNDALCLWGEAGGDGGANCKNTREKNLVLMTHAGYHQADSKIMPFWKPHLHNCIIASYHKTNWFTSRLILFCNIVTFNFLNVFKKCCSLPAFCILPHLHLPLWQCDWMQGCKLSPPPCLMSVCKMSTWSDALAQFPQEYALILRYGLCRCSMWSETY